MYSFVQLVLQLFNPSVCFHAWLDHHHVWFAAVIATSLQTLLHRALKLVCNLSITVTIKHTPSFEGCLGKHFALDLAIDLTSVLLNIEAHGRTIRTRTHQEITCFILESLKFLRIFVELQVPHFLLLDTFSISLEVTHEVFNLFDLGFSIGVQDDCKVLHQVEVGSHRVSQAGQLTEFGNKGDLITRSPVLVNQQWLIHVLDALVVASLVVVGVARWSTLLVKSC